MPSPTSKSEISIHASREGSDQGNGISFDAGIISIHASREGSDAALILKSPSHYGFQSTLPAREATYYSRLSCQSPGQFQSTLPAREATLTWAVVNAVLFISIHASREGSDPWHCNDGRRPAIFQSTLPAREATHQWTVWSCSDLHFNPRFPRGKRRVAVTPSTWASGFQSTLPAREATLRAP